MTAQQTGAAFKQAGTAFQAGFETIEKAIGAGVENADRMARFGGEAVAKGYDQAMALAKEQVKTYFPAALKSFEELAAFNKANLEAALAAGTATAKGVEAVAKQVYAFNRASFEQSMDKAATLTQCKSAKDIFELQLDAARAQFDACVAEGGRISELTVKATNDFTQPIANRMTEAVEKAFKPVA